MPSAALILSFMMAFLAPPDPAAGGSARPQPSATFPPHGGAFVTSLPATASAWLDGVYVGATPVYVDDLLPGHHSVTFSSAGWQPQTVSFDVTVGRIAPVSVVLSRAQGNQTSKEQGMLAFAGAPAGSHVFVDGVSIGTIPVQPRAEASGYHIVTLQPPGVDAIRSTRFVDVFPNTTTTVSFAGAVTPQELSDDILEPIDTVVPPNGVAIAGNDVIIHYRNIEIECTIGSRAYTINGKSQTMSISPAVVGGKVYVPQSLLARLAGK